MDKFVPYEKLSKKKKRELNAQRRKTWGNISPVTRREDLDDFSTVFFYVQA